MASTNQTTKAVSSSNPLLAAYLSALAAHPLRTKMITSGFFSALAEIVAGKLAGVATPTKVAQVSEKKSSTGQQHPLHLVKAYAQAAGIDRRALQMALYGFLISAPMGHVLTGLLQKAFAGRTTAKDKLLQIITSNLTVSVLANVVYLSCMAYINGAKTFDRISKTVKAAFWPVMRVTWTTSPVIIAFAQNYLAPQVWEPFFTLIRFFLSTYFNTIGKKRQMAIAKAEAAKAKDQTQTVDAAQPK